AFVFAQRISERLERAETAMRTLGAGDLSVRIEEHGRDEIAEVGRTFNQMVVGLKEKEFVERAFGRYVAPGVLASLRARGSMLNASERKEATVLYADVRGFTAFSEGA